MPEINEAKLDAIINMMTTFMEEFRDGNPKEEIENFVKTHLKLDIKMKKAYAIGERACILEMDNFADKKCILENKKKLNNIVGPRVYIDNDLTPNERKIQKVIKIKANEEKTNGNKVKIGYRKLFINDKRFIWCDERNMLIEATHVPKN
ncbi:hypothetical protein QE152_g1773 [Popillia japonica]|uniref:Uncharacterized protein n=1 Tax=Popillia japonica TaxID=7064 RepID=A0AAW1N5M6_POPJA